jgi:hypothetical protein
MYDLPPSKTNQDNPKVVGRMANDGPEIDRIEMTYKTVMIKNTRILAGIHLEVPIDMMKRYVVDTRHRRQQEVEFI